MLRIFVITLALLSGTAAAHARSSDGAESVLRYRGKYTYGHEVRAFCPAINSQCYWVGSGTGADIHAVLKDLATARAAAPYEPVCVVVEGVIDREALRSGFAASYDGLITVLRVFGRCDETQIVTQGDLQHHRWLLESVNDEMLDPAALVEGIPELDFGERMTVSGNTGCNRYSGQARLREAFFTVERMISTRRACAPTAMDLERTVQRVLSSESVITIGADWQLILDSEHGRLRFRLSDWKQ